MVALRSRPSRAAEVAGRPVRCENAHCRSVVSVRSSLQRRGPSPRSAPAQRSRVAGSEERSTRAIRLRRHARFAGSRFGISRCTSSTRSDESGLLTIRAAARSDVMATDDVRIVRGASRRRPIASDLEPPQQLAHRVDHFALLDVRLPEREVERERQRLVLQLRRRSSSGGRPSSAPASRGLLADVVARQLPCREARARPAPSPLRCRRARPARAPTCSRCRPRGTCARMRSGMSLIEQRLGDRRARLADDLRDLLVRVAELLLQDVEAFRFFERRQVLALDVLDQRDLELLLVVDVELDGRDLVESRQRRGAEAALAGDDLVAVRADRRGRGSARARPSRGSTPPAPRCCRGCVRGCSAFGSMSSSGIIEPMCRPERARQLLDEMRVVAHRRSAREVRV